MAEPLPAPDCTYLSTDAAARYITLRSPQTLRAWRSRGIGPKHVVLGPNRVCYRKSDLDAFMNSRVAANTADAMARGLTPVPSPPKSRTATADSGPERAA